MNGEDCAFTSTDKSSGRRGLCGTIFIFKIAVAVAEDGENLHTIVASTKQVSASMRPMGLALRAATLALQPTWAPCSTWSVIAWRKGYGCMGSLGASFLSSSIWAKRKKSHPRFFFFGSNVAKFWCAARFFFKISYEKKNFYLTSESFSSSHLMWNIRICTGYKIWYLCCTGQ